MLGTAWDYQDYPDEFIAKLAAIEERGVITLMLRHPLVTSELQPLAFDFSVPRAL